MAAANASLGDLRNWTHHVQATVLLRRLTGSRCVFKSVCTLRGTLPNLLTSLCSGSSYVFFQCVCYFSNNRSPILVAPTVPLFTIFGSCLVGFTPSAGWVYSTVPLSLYCINNADVLYITGLTDSHLSQLHLSFANSPKGDFYSFLKGYEDGRHFELIFLFWGVSIVCYIVVYLKCTLYILLASFYYFCFFVSCF